MRRWQMALICLICLTVDEGLTGNILMFGSGVSRSHLMFTYRLAATLFSQGHNVTMVNWMLPASDDLKPPTGVEEFRVYLPTDPTKNNTENAVQHEAVQAYVFSMDADRFTKLLRLADTFAHYNEITAAFCRATFDQKQTLAQLRRKQFDLLLGPILSLCPLAVAEWLGIQKTLFVSTGGFVFEYIAAVMGLPAPSSYVPVSVYGTKDRMSFLQRLENAVMHLVCLVHLMPIGAAALDQIAVRQSGLFTGVQLQQLAMRPYSLLTNGDEIFNYPKPRLQGIVSTGELQNDVDRPLQSEWQRYANSSGVIIFSLGTMADTSVMPMRQKVAFINAFKRFPEYDVICRMEGKLPEGLESHSHIKNVKWMPQRELLQHANVVLFITHGGYNSLIEAMSMGIPMLVLPLFADQDYNAELVVHFGAGLQISKANLTEEAIYSQMERIIRGTRFRQQSRKMAELMRHKILPNDVLMAKQIDRILRSRRWPTMKAAQQLNFDQYFGLDVITSFIAVAIFLNFVFS